MHNSELNAPKKLMEALYMFLVGHGFVLGHSFYSVVKRFTYFHSLLEVADCHFGNPHSREYGYLLYVCGKF